MSIRVLIVDDHAVVRQGLKVLLESQPHIEVVGEADEGGLAVEIAQKLKPDVILLDLLMPGVDGLETLRRLQDLKVTSKVLVLTSSLDEQLVKQAIQAGAQGYVLKAIRAGELVQAIDRIAQGSRVLDPAATQVLLNQVTRSDPLEQLTGREREVFEALGRGKNNLEIADQLKISEATVRTHIASVLEKLGLRDRTQVTIYALKRGLIRLEDLP
jgi:NarL family two-component system response regulator LiaR